MTSFVMLRAGSSGRWLFCSNYRSARSLATPALRLLCDLLGRGVAQVDTAGCARRFKEFVQGHALHELATKEEVAVLRPSVQAQAEKDAAEAVQKSAEAAAEYVERIKAADAEAVKAAEVHAAASQALQTATQASQATAAAAQQAAAGAAHPGSPQDAIAAAREAAEAAAVAAAEVGSKSSQEAAAKAASDAAAAAAAGLRANAPPGTDALLRGEPLPQTAPQVSLSASEYVTLDWRCLACAISHMSKARPVPRAAFSVGASGLTCCLAVQLSTIWWSWLYAACRCRSPMTC